MPASPIRRLAPLADAAKARGVEVLHLNIGQPDIPTPRPVIEAFQRYDAEVLAYGPAQGLNVLREAVAGYYSGLGFDIQARDVTVGFGGSEALVFALTAVTDPGDEVVVFEPFYANYLGFSTLSSTHVRPVPCDPSQGYRLPPDAEIEAAIHEKTRAFLFCSPGNPTGTVFTAEEMARIGRLAEKHDLFIISDEVYNEFAYGVPVTSALSLPCAKERVIVCDSVSKRFSACGARIGFLITQNEAIQDAVLRMCVARLCPTTVDQLAAAEAYKMPSNYFAKVLAEYQTRRDTLIAGLRAIPEVSVHEPEGAFYLMVRLPIADVDHFASWLLTDFSDQNQTLMMAPGTGFYATPGAGKSEARLAYVLGVPKLKRAVELLRIALAKYPGL